MFGLVFSLFLTRLSGLREAQRILDRIEAEATQQKPPLRPPKFLKNRLENGGNHF